MRPATVALVLWAVIATAVVWLYARPTVDTVCIASQSLSFDGDAIVNAAECLEVDR